jgi:hypothetical protein
METKKCVRCGQTKPIELFRWSSLRDRANGEQKRYRDSWCPDCRNEYNRNHPGIKQKKAAYQRKYRLRDLEEFKRKKRASRQANAATHNARGQRWVARNPEKRRLSVLACEHNRRAAKWRKSRGLCREAVEQTLALARIGDWYLDAYTGELIDNPTIDHVTPLSLGGTNDADNLCITSLANNSSKFNDVLIVWLVKRTRQSRAT